MFNTNNRDSIGTKLVSIISVLVLVVGMFPLRASAVPGNGNGNSDNSTAVCHTTGNGSWNEITVSNQGELNGHLGHGDFQVDDENPCPPVTIVDTDEDTIADSTDNCPTIANTDQTDTDNDGIGDDCDESPNGDVCPNVTGEQSTGPCVDETCVSPNTWNVDTQNCDEPVIQDTDADDDGVDDAMDNCLQDYNPTQLDSDNDGVGNECDEDPFTDLAEEIVCGIYEDLGLLPIPEFCNDESEDPSDADGDGISDSEDACPEDSTNTCNDESDDGQNDGEENNEQEDTSPTPSSSGGNPFATCMNGIDDDGDGLSDMNDPGCGNPFDGNESDEAYDENGTIVDRSGAVLGTSTTTDETGLGGSNEGVCPALFNAFIGLHGTTPDPEAVTFLQEFLNDELGLSLEVNGEYNQETIDAVKEFQTRYAREVLAPWGITDPTGIVFKTTQRMINMRLCPTLDIPMPELN